MNKIKINKIAVLLLSISLITINLLIYSFFKLEINRNFLRIFAIILVLMATFFDKKLTYKDMLFIAIGLFILVRNGSLAINILFIIILFIELSTINNERIILMLNILQACLLTVVILSLLFGIVNNVNWTYLGRTRNTFGFSHVNYTGLLCFSLSSLLLMGKIKNINITIALIFFVNYYIFKMTNSRTGFLGISIMIGLYLLFQIFNADVIKFIVVFCITFLFISPVIWESQVLNTSFFNSLLSQRPAIFFRYIQEMNIMDLLFGGAKGEEIDNFYLLLLYNTGIFIYLGCYLMVLKAAIVSVLKNKWMEVSFIISILIIGLMESSLLRPEIPCMVYFWNVAYKNNNDPQFTKIKWRNH